MTVRLQQGGHFVEGLHSDTMPNGQYYQRRLDINLQDT